MMMMCAEEINEIKIAGCEKKKKNFKREASKTERKMNFHEKIFHKFEGVDRMHFTDRWRRYFVTVHQI